MKTLHEPLAVTADTPSALVEQAQGISRGPVMKNIVGPFLDTLLRPIYTPELTPDEVERLPIVGPLHDTARRLAMMTIDILEGRLSERLNERGEEYEGLERLRATREDLFHEPDTISITLQEGISSGVIVPLTVAAHIDAIERGAVTQNITQGGTDPNTPFEPITLTEIFNRDSFARILQHLTKGPNGFLGAASTRTSRMLKHGRFFNFTDNAAKALCYWDAYALQNGKVVDLNADFHLYAQFKRELLRSGFHAEVKRILKNPQDDESSGCPVRHSFKDEHGEPQEPLIVTSAKFVVATMAEIS